MFLQAGLPIKQVGSQMTLLVGATAEVCRSLHVVLIGVLAYGAIRRKRRRQARHAFTHAGHPAARNSILVAVVKRGNNVCFEQSIESFGFCSVPGRIVTMLAPVADGPTDFR